MHGAVRITYPTAAHDARVRNAWFRLGLLCAFVLAAIAAVGFLLARSVTRPVQKLEETAEQIAEGDLSARAPTEHGAPEFARLRRRSTALRIGSSNSSMNRNVLSPMRRINCGRRWPHCDSESRTSNRIFLPVKRRRSKRRSTRSRASGASLTDCSRSRSDMDHAGLHPVDVAEVAREHVDAWRNVATEQGVTLRSVGSRQLWARTPVGGVEQILDNLLANAIAVAPAGSSVTVTASSNGRSVDLRVNDQGPGLEPEQRERAFERFWRGDMSSPGTGLGLPIVRQLARIAGGDARLEVGDGGRGLAAVVQLPRSHKHAEAPGTRGISNPALTHFKPALAVQLFTLPSQQPSPLCTGVNVKRREALIAAGAITGTLCRGHCRVQPDHRTHQRSCERRSRRARPGHHGHVRGAGRRRRS